MPLLHNESGGSLSKSQIWCLDLRWCRGRTMKWLCVSRMAWLQLTFNKPFADVNPYEKCEVVFHRVSRSLGDWVKDVSWAVPEMHIKLLGFLKDLTAWTHSQSLKRGKWGHTDPLLYFTRHCIDYNDNTKWKKQSMKLVQTQIMLNLGASSVYNDYGYF